MHPGHPEPAGPEGVGPDSSLVDDGGVGPRSDASNLVNGAVLGALVQAGAIYGGVHNYGLSAAVRLPYRFGRVPPRADAFQRRRVAADLVGALTGGDVAVLTSDGPGLDVSAHADVLSGLGGVGKTQLAAGYAEHTWAAGAVDLLVWVTASSSEAIVGDYSRLAKDLTGVDDPDPATGADRLLTWLASTSARWLVVLDDLQDPSDLNGLWPPRTVSGRVVVTTRRRDAALRGDGRRVVEVGLFTPDESATYLAAKLADNARLVEGPHTLAERLGHLPLALAQAATYLIDRHLTCAQYLDRFEDKRRKLLTLLPQVKSLPDQHRETVAATWSLSVEHANRLEPAGLAGPLLDLVALLDPNGIPVSALEAPAVLTHLAEAAGRPVDAEQARDALTCLDRLSLITYDHDNVHAEIRVHALVQRAIRDQQTELQAWSLPIVAADALLEVWPRVEIDTALVQSLRANAAALHAAAGDRLWRTGCHLLLLQAGNSLAGSGQVIAACDYFEELSTAAGQHLGPHHVDTFVARSKLAFWKGEAGDLAAAVVAFEQLFFDRLQVFGPDHPSTLATRGDLAFWRAEAGYSSEIAAELQHLLGDDTSSMVWPDELTLNGRAFWREESVNLAEVMAATEDLLGEQLRVLGPNDPITLTTRGRLARWRGEAGDRTGALVAFEQLLDDLARVLGPDHLDTLTTRNNLAFARGENDDPAGAAAALRDLLEDQTRVLGPQHPDTLSVRINLGFWQRRSGDLLGAMAAFCDLLDDQVQALGSDHPSTFTTRAHLARWLGETGDANGAFAAFEQLLADRVRVLGADHSSIGTTRSNVAYWRSKAKLA